MPSIPLPIDYILKSIDGGDWPEWRIDEDPDYAGRYKMLRRQTADSPWFWIKQRSWSEGHAQRVIARQFTIKEVLP